MADMEHLFREQETREQAEATGRPTANEIFKTASYRAEKTQVQLTLTRTEMYALLGKIREALKL